jgi:hypothetical protein
MESSEAEAMTCLVAGLSVAGDFGWFCAESDADNIINRIAAKVECDHFNIAVPPVSEGLGIRPVLISNSREQSGRAYQPDAVRGFSEMNSPLFYQAIDGPRAHA